MKKVALFSVAGVSIIIGVILLASSSVTKKGISVKTASAACEPEVDTCLPRIGYLDTKDTMWTGELVEGKVVVINFWATWCAPCKTEIPDLTELYKKHKDKGLVLLGIMTDSDKITDEKLNKFASTYNLDFPVIRIDQQIFADFNEPGRLPTTFVYNRAGKRVFSHLGAVRRDEFDELITDLLAEPPPEKPTIQTKSGES